MGEKTYRTFRWGKDLQIWLSENRDFPSSNKMKDGPEKTIWGREQKAWFKKTVEASDATFKVLIMPGPIVGPDKKGKRDNHCNAGFKHEGDELRAFIAKEENMFVICGDRHVTVIADFDVRVDPTQVAGLGFVPVPVLDVEGKPIRIVDRIDGSISIQGT